MYRHFWKQTPIVGFTSAKVYDDISKQYNAKNKKSWHKSLNLAPLDVQEIISTIVLIRNDRDLRITPNTKPIFLKILEGEYEEYKGKPLASRPYAQVLNDFLTYKTIVSDKALADSKDLIKKSLVSTSKAKAIVVTPLKTGINILELLTSKPVLYLGVAFVGYSLYNKHLAK
jgi:hypothetical protein